MSNASGQFIEDGELRYERNSNRMNFPRRTAAKNIDQHYNTL